MLALAAGIGAYIAYRVVRFGEAVGDVAKRLWDGITFDPASMGPFVTLTPGARMSEEEYLRLGFLERLPDGRTRITPLGEWYIEMMRASGE